jgi:hypothetical protein
MFIPRIKEGGGGGNRGTAAVIMLYVGKIRHSGNMKEVNVSIVICPLRETCLYVALEQA